MTYDYVIVGAGTAGLVLANRLTENPGTTVLVLEAGMSDQNVVPAIAPFLGPTVTPGEHILAHSFDWNYTVVPQAGMMAERGSSSANYLLHQYGPNDDWNRMATVTGDPGWAWDNVRKYLQRHENFVPPIDGHNTTDQFIPSLHSFTGEVPISLPVFNQSIDARVIATTQQLSQEFPFNDDMSGISGQSIGQGVRRSSSTTYLAASNDRPNLTVLINAMPFTSGLKAFRTVEFTDSRSSSDTTSSCTERGILSAGSIGTVQILQLSGIGNSADLAPFNIPVLVNSPMVGRNLMDHTLLPNIFTVHGNDSFDHILQDPVQLEDAVNQWVVNKTGFISNNVANNFGFSRVRSDLINIPDPASGPNTPHFEMIYVVSGTIKIRSTNPFDAPLIDPNMLTTDFDITAMRESVKAIKQFVTAPAWSDYVIAPVGNLSATSDAGIDAYVRQGTTTIFHPSGTASMTSKDSANGVVNPDFTVKGAEGLRIVDLSVVPFVPACHPQGPVYLIAERAADIIKGVNVPLAQF
ncbi:hypothetical protein BJ912DRAFT_1022454 [Pholiota molesta]|nr:hypothetical protein BJ912DRAFT_1022454 [Pholiota molesta]